MKNKFFVVTSALGVVLLVFLISQNKTALSPVASSEKLARKKAVRKSLKETKYLIPKTAKSQNTFPSQCSSALYDLSSMSADEYKDLLKDHDSFKEFFREDCFKKLVQNKTFKELLKNSNCSITDVKAQKVEATCFTLMFMLKASFIADHTGGKDFKEMTPEELASNFVKMFMNIDKLTKESFAENLKLVNELQERYPDDLDVTEAHIGYLMVGKQVTGMDSVEERIDSLLIEAQGKSFKVDRLNVIRDILKKDFASAGEKLAQLEKIYPNEADLSYYKAAYFWKQGDPIMAQKHLGQAIERSRNCVSCNPSLYGETMSRLESAKPGAQDLFSISIGLNFENL